LVLFVAKWMATTSAYAWGNCGGIFTPTLFLGAMIGGACSQSINLGIELDQDSQRLLTIVGMSACLGAVVRAPITSILIVFEMTHDFALVPPLMLGALVSQAISRSLCPDNFYNQFLKDSGIRLETNRSLRAQASWRNRPVSSFANFEAPCLRSCEKAEVKNILQKSPDTIFTLLNKDDYPTGIVERTQLESFLETGKTPLLQNPIFAHPNQTMQDIEPLLKQAPLGSLILVSRNQRYLGLFTSSDAAQSQKNEDELANS